MGVVRLHLVLLTPYAAEFPLKAADSSQSHLQVLHTLARGDELINLKSKDRNEITGAQIRAARSLLRWSAKDLAIAAEVGVATVSRAEVKDGLPPITAPNLRAIQMALEDAGVEFIHENGGGVGVRFRTPGLLTSAETGEAD